MRFVLRYLCILSVIFFSVFSLYAEDCDGPECISSPNFTISVGDITPGSTELLDESTGSSDVVDNVLETILNKLILVFGALSILIMTIGAGYMIIYHGEDSYLSKGKEIFVSGLIALAVALSAGLIVQLFASILYNVS